jgi:hypothetical protein
MEEHGDDAPLEREELTLPDGRRVILYTRAEETED